MLHPLVVFISSTGDLEEHRDAVASALKGLEIDGSRFESWPSSPAAPISECLTRIEESDAAVLLLGSRYGSLAPDGISVTHLEFRHATKCGKPVFVFLIEHDDPDPEQRAFIEEVQSTRFRAKPIANPKALRRAVRISFLSEFTRCFRNVHSQPPQKLPIPPSQPEIDPGSLPTRVEDATTFVAELYGSGRDREIRTLAPQLELRFSDVPEILNFVYMAEVNAAMAGEKPVAPRLERAIDFWESTQMRSRFARFSLLYNQGNALGALGSHAEAVAKYEAALAQQSDFAPCWKNLGTAKLDLGDPAAARECFERALLLEPGLMEALYSLGNLAVDEGDFDRALSYFGRIDTGTLTADRAAAVWAWRAFIHEKTGRYGEAARCAADATRIAPTLDWTWDFAGRLHAIARNAEEISPSESCDFWERFVARSPTRAEAWAELGLALFSTRQDDREGEARRKAAVAFSSAVDRGLDDAWIYDKLGHLHDEISDAEAAEREFRRAAEANPHSYGYCLGKHLLQVGDYMEALPWLLEAAEGPYPDALTWGDLGFCYSRIRLFDSAIQAYETAIEIDPEYAIAWFNLGGMYWNKGDSARARQIWAEAIRKFPDNEHVKAVRAIIDDSED